MATSKKASRANRTIAAKKTQPDTPQMTKEDQRFDDDGAHQAQPGQMQDGTSSEVVTALAPATGQDQTGPLEQEFPTGEPAASERTLVHVDLGEATAEQAVVAVEEVQQQLDSNTLPTDLDADAAQTSQPQPEEDKEELPVADNNDIPALPADLGTFALSALGGVVDYIKTMHPRRPNTTTEVLQQQTALYRALTTLINKVEGEEFTRAWSWLLEQFVLYRQGVFAEKYVFRGFEDITLNEADRKAFQRLLNLVKATCDPRSRAVTLKQIDLTKTLELGVTEPGRQRVLQFYGV
jgi:hypothetical protein